MRLLLFLLCLSSVLTTVAQNVQIVRGKVLDKETKQPIIGATVFVKDIEPQIATVTDVDGNFTMENVPLGRQTILAQYVGYNPFAADNLIVSAAKELYLEIEMIESSQMTDEVLITATAGSNTPLNELSVVSTRSFSVEETQRYAASINDPGRMVMAFPGVQSNNDSENDIVIRGNSAVGVLWRVEGMDIANPNHFARPATTGGGVSVFSASLLSNSDFSTGAFAAEYGNAFSGVFDMRFRKGNLQNREYTFRFGLIGVDLATEGPIKKGRSSYLINARYSTLGILGNLGIYVIRDNVSNNFQDLSFNLFFSSPDSKSQFTVFGMGGLSQENWWMRDTARWEYNYDYDWNKNNSNLGVLGMTYTRLLNEKSFLKMTLGGSVSEIFDFQISPRITADSAFWLERNDYLNTQFTFHPVYSYKVSSQLRFKAGLISSYHLWDLEYGEDRGGTGYVNMLGSFTPLGLRSVGPADSSEYFVPNGAIELERGRGTGLKGNSFLQQAYVQTSWRPTEKLTINAGAHAMYLALNNTAAIDPRLSFKYAAAKKTTFTLAYGLHSKALPWGTYMLTFQDSTGNNYQPNKDLKFTRSHHVVAGVEQIIGKSFRVSLEGYYQYLFNIPISTDQNSSYWFYNMRDNYGIMPMTDAGTGQNYGADLLFEKFFTKGFFVIVSGSYLRSTYKAWNNEFRSTRMDNFFSSSLIGTKEFTLNQGKGGVLQLGLKAFFRGALRYETVDTLASQSSGFFVPNESRAYDAQFKKPYFRTDARLAYRRDYKKINWMLALDIQNVTNQVNYRSYQYNRNTLGLEPDANSSLTPVLSFQLDF
jgi:hypothetical protein